MDIRAAIEGQCRGALAMLKQAMEDCPNDLWAGGPYAVPFWQVVYHTLYFTHLYLQQTIDEFRPWEHHREDYHDLPWPPGSGPKLDHPYARPELLDYWSICDGMVDECIDRMDLDAPGSGFPWHKTMPKLDHQLQNIRHIQHHAALLAGRLRAANGTDVRWVRAVPMPP